MELGNLLFGHSRGTYPVDRDLPWGEIFFKLQKKLNPDTQGYGEFYENSTFSMMPYYWGEDCTCGFQLVDESHTRLRKLKHRKACYQVQLRYTTEAFLSKAGVPSYYKLTKHQQKKHDKLVANLCRDLGLSYPEGSLVHCTCDLSDRYEAVLSQYQKEYGLRECKPTCMLVAPNFTYKPTGFTISWYKYPFRDSYMNQQISTRQFTLMIKDCIKSIGG